MGDLRLMRTPFDAQLQDLLPLFTVNLEKTTGFPYVNEASHGECSAVPTIETTELTEPFACEFLVSDGCTSGLRSQFLCHDH